MDKIKSRLRPDKPGHIGAISGSTTEDSISNAYDVVNIRIKLIIIICVNNNGYLMSKRKKVSGMKQSAKAKALKISEEALQPTAE